MPVALLLLLAVTGNAEALPAAGSAMVVVVAAAIRASVLTSGIRRTFAAAERLSEMLADRTAKLDRLSQLEESIVERLPDPLILLGPDRTIRRANAAARAAFGSEMQAVLRHPELRAAIDRAQLPQSRAPEALASQATPALPPPHPGSQPGSQPGPPEPQIADLFLPVPVPREVQAVVLALGGEAADPGILVVLSDRSRERAVERMRADFVANASHELRTPLASLIGFIDTLLGPAADDPPAQTRFLRIMAEQAQRMNRLIDDLLSLSRIEITEHQPPAGRVNLAEAIGRALATFEIRIRERGATLDLRIEDNLPAIQGDADQLGQVLQNLLDNALKYGRENGVLTVTLARAPQGGRWPARPGLLLAVADDGNGIPRQHLPRLTERFYRVDTGRSRAIGGTGLGLAIVKHITNRHRGMLLIESEPGRGSTFSIWLPEGL